RPERHLETVQHERGGHAGGGAPTEDAAGVRVEHERDVDPPGPRPDIREVGNPELIGAEPREVPVDEVSRSGLPRIRINRTLATTANDTGDPQLPHEPFDRAAGDVVPVAAEAEPELARAEHLPLLLPGGQDDRPPAFVGQRTGRRPAPAGGLERRWGDLHVVLGEHGADRLDTPSEPTIGAVLVLLDERDYRRCGRSSSAAKKAEAAFKISFARRNSAFSRLSRLISTAASVV